MRRPLLACVLGLAGSAAVFFLREEAAMADSIEAGWAVVEITPPVPYRMCGYFYERPSTGVHDPLHAKALVLRQGARQVAIVLCDMIGVSPELGERTRRLASEKTGIPASCVVVAATHSHTGALYFGSLWRHLHEKAIAEHGEDPLETTDYRSQLEARIVESVVEAQKALRPVELAAGKARETELSFNRRFHMKSGPPVRFNPGQLNPDILRPAGPIDPEVGLVLLRDAASRRPLASLTVFALHLDTTGGTLYSADYPYYLAGSLRQVYGEGFVSFFGVGTCGDVNHIDVSRSDCRTAQQIGEKLAEVVRSGLDGLAAMEPSLEVASETIRVPVQKSTPEEIAWAKKMMDEAASDREPFLDRVKACKITEIVELRPGDTLPLEVQAIRLGPDAAIVALPGEVFVELGLAIKQGSPFATTLVVELANDYPAYVPTQKAFAEGSYETVNSQVQPGGGEKMVEAALRLLGQLKPREATAP